MRKLVLLALLTLCHIVTHSQTPEKFSYQAVIRDASGNIRANVSVTVQLAILQGSATGTAVYSESHGVPTNAFGLVNLALGGGTVEGGNFSAIDWAAGPFFIKVKVDGVEYGTSQILSVPYALYAKKAANVFSGNYNDLTNKPELFDGTWNSLTGKPAFATVATSGSYNDLLNKPVLFDGTWASLTGKPAFAVVATSGKFSDLLSRPTTLSEYGITDAMSTSHAANSISSTMITNWNTAFGWGNHAGLYRPVSYVPAWSEITNKPSTVAGYNITDAVTIAGNQTISGNKTFTGTTSVSTPVNNSDAVTKEYVDQMLKTLSIALQGVQDADGNHYNAVLIGDQLWMAENLKTTKYKDGTSIPLVTDNTAWSNLTTPAYCWYNNNSSYKNIYGALYNGYTVQTGNLCPTGWHVPTSDEFATLKNFLIANGYNYDGTTTGNKIAKSMAATTNWSASTYVGTPGNLPSTNNSSGFSGPPGGLRAYSGTFYYMGNEGYWWTASISGTYGTIESMNYASMGVSEPSGPVKTGLSVRCLKDN